MLLQMKCLVRLYSEIVIKMIYGCGQFTVSRDFIE